MSHKKIIVVFLVVIIVLIAILSYLLGAKQAKAPVDNINGSNGSSKNKQEQNRSVTTKQKDNSTEVVVSTGTENWEIYRNSQYNFEIKHPSNWNVESTGAGFSYEYEEGKKSVRIDESLAFRAFTDEGARVHLDITSDAKILEYLQAEIKNSSKTKVINGKTYTEYSREGMGDVRGYIIKQDNYYYAIEAAFDDGFFEKMMNSLKFSAEQGIVYSNPDFGFQITIPQGYPDWKPMIEKDYGGKGISYIHFIFKTNDPQWKNLGEENFVTKEKFPGYASIFALEVWEREVYEKRKIECEINPAPDCLNNYWGENKQYIFGGSIGNGNPPADLEKLRESLANQSLAQALNFKVLGK